MSVAIFYLWYIHTNVQQYNKSSILQLRGGRLRNAETLKATPLRRRTIWHWKRIWSAMPKGLMTCSCQKRKIGGRGGYSGADGAKNKLSNSLNARTPYVTPVHSHKNVAALHLGPDLLWDANTNCDSNTFECKVLPCEFLRSRRQNWPLKNTIDKKVR